MNDKFPLVSVVCLCYNHEWFIAEALESVRKQTYPNLEIIIVDDCSTDNSRKIIEQYVQKYPQIQYLANDKNMGNCRAFNRAFAIAKGAYVIDFATDDILFPERISEQVAAFEKLPPDYGILFTDAALIDDNGKFLRNFYKRNADGTLQQKVPSGEVFEAILNRHFICTPTMIMRRSVLEKLNGYDEKLAYEDFDLWVRSAPFYKYYFLDKVLTGRRIHAAQLSQQQYKPNDKQIFSTIAICRKAQKLVRNKAEKKALINRVELEFKQAFLTQNNEALNQLYELLQELETPELIYKLLFNLSRLNLPVHLFRKLYYRFRYNKTV